MIRTKMGARRTTTRAGLGAVTVGLLLAVTACGGGSSGSGSGAGSDEAFRITVMSPQSGALSVLGEAVGHSVRAAEKVINEDGGVDGKPIEIEFVDTGSDPAEGTAATQKVVSASDLPNALVVGTPSAILVPAAPLITRAQIFATTNATAPVLDDREKFPHIFGANVTPKSHVVALAAELERQGFSRVGLLAIDSEIGAGVANALEASLDEAGIDLTTTFVPTTSVDATPQLDSLLDSEPEALVFDGFGPGVANLLAARQKSGVDIPAYADWNVTGDTAAHWESGGLTGMTLQALPIMIKDDPATESESFKRFLDAVREETGGELAQPILTYVAFYNEVVLAAAAANEAESWSAEDLSAAVPELTNETAPLFVAAGGIESFGYSTDSNFPTVPASEFLFVPAGPTEDSMLVPGGE